MLQLILLAPLILLFVWKPHCCLSHRHYRKVAEDFPKQINLQFESQFAMCDRSALRLQLHFGSVLQSLHCCSLLRGYCSLCCSSTIVCLVARCIQGYCQHRLSFLSLMQQVSPITKTTFKVKDRKLQCKPSCLRLYYCCYYCIGTSDQNQSYFHFLGRFPIQSFHP